MYLPASTVCTASERERRPRTMKEILKALGAFLLWDILAGVALLLLPPLAAIAVTGVLFAGFLWGFVLRPEGSPGALRRRATLRLRPLSPEGVRATLAAVPVLFVLSWALGEVWMRLVPVPPESLAPFRALTGTPLGRLAVTLLAVACAPLLEEFVFRGLVQHPLERRWGPAPAIALTSLVFALGHLLPWVLPLHLLLGLTFGYAVYATRSIWAGVILHAANNSLAALGLDTSTPEVPATVWKTGPTPELWTALAVLVLASAAAVWVARWLWRAGHPGGTERAHPK